jgi:hypothetical protein
MPIHRSKVPRSFPGHTSFHIHKGDRTMRTSTDFTIDEILYLDPKILAEALNLFQHLIAWVDNDVFT